MLWSSKKSISYFKNKGQDDFFVSEKEMLSRINLSIANILDLGCASGKFIELLKTQFRSLTYTGYDIVQEQINIATVTYPDHNFICDDIKNIKNNSDFDLVNATGVLLHEPDFPTILKIMITASKKFVLFDVKFADISDHETDIDKSYSQIDQHRLPYVIYSPQKFINFLRELEYIKKIEVFGYPTEINGLTVIPPEITQIYSASILLTKSKKPVDEPIIMIEFNVHGKTYRGFDFLDRD